MAAGGPTPKGPSPGATLGGAEKGTAGPRKPGAGTRQSPDTNRTTKVQGYQRPSPRAAECAATAVGGVRDASGGTEVAAGPAEPAPGAAAETKDGGAALRPQLEDFRSHPPV